MARFVYRAPRGNPAHCVTGMAGEWESGVAQDVEGDEVIAWLRRHPHWEEVAEPAEAEAPRRRGRQPKAPEGEGEE